MSDFEDKLRALSFREPPRDLRRRVLAAAETAPQRWSWRDWLWPSPAAWAALAVLLIAVLLLDSTIDSSPAHPAQTFAADAPPPVLYAYQARQAALLELRF
jgi:hypothetical protein